MIVSHQGTRITAGQRQQLAFRERCKAAFLSPVLKQTVDETLKAVEQRKEQGVKPEQIWFFDSQSSGTLCVAEWMGY